MKQRYNEGFSLIESLVAIVLLGALVVPICTSLIMSHRINAKTEQMLQDQLAVSSAVETLMAEGSASEFAVEKQFGVSITGIPESEVWNNSAAGFDVQVTIEGSDSVCVKTYIKNTGKPESVTDVTEEVVGQ